MRPGNFSWVIPDKLAGFSRPTEPESLKWLRSKGVELVMTLTEGPLPRTWVNDAGLICINGCGGTLPRWSWPHRHYSGSRAGHQGDDFARRLGQSAHHASWFR